MKFNFEGVNFYIVSFIFINDLRIVFFYVLINYFFLRSVIDM